MATIHLPVLLEEVVDWVRPIAQSCIIDGTFGGGGHARALLEVLPQHGVVIGIDRDPNAIKALSELKSNSRMRLWNGSYADASEAMASCGQTFADAILLDLGLSSDQLADANRGFSFQSDGPLDLRFNPNEGESAATLLQRIDERSLADLIYGFGEERFSRRIARAIVERRRTEPIRTASDLRNLIHRCVPGGHHGRIDSATRTFQALRIAVNRELDHLTHALERLPDCLRLGGRLLIISFHSLEDRLVKNAFRSDPRLQPLTKKPIVATDSEIRRNPRSRSAKLRVAERIVSEPLSG